MRAFSAAELVYLAADGRRLAQLRLAADSALITSVELPLATSSVMNPRKKSPVSSIA